MGLTYDTELLTPTGWKKVSGLTTKDKIAEFDSSTATISYGQILDISKEPETSWCMYAPRSIRREKPFTTYLNYKFPLSSDHVIFYSSRPHQAVHFKYRPIKWLVHLESNGWYTFEAWHFKLPQAHTGLFYSDYEGQLNAFIFLNNFEYIDDDTVKLTIKHSRKSNKLITRLKALLSQLDISAKIKLNTHKTIFEFKFNSYLYKLMTSPNIEWFNLHPEFYEYLFEEAKIIFSINKKVRTRSKFEIVIPEEKAWLRDLIQFAGQSLGYKCNLSKQGIFVRTDLRTMKFVAYEEETEYTEKYKVLTLKGIFPIRYNGRVTLTGGEGLNVSDSNV